MGKVVHQGGRFYGLRYLNVVVAQRAEGMVVQSRHRLYSAARKQAEKLARSSEVTVYAALSLVGNPRNDYKPGDLLDHEDVVWGRVPDSCSECCDNCRPDSLDYRCPITRDHPLCDTVKARRLVPLGVDA